MTIDLAQVADLDRRARDAGMEGILPDGVRIDDFCILFYARGYAIPTSVATAAVTHWLREWLRENWKLVKLDDYDLLCDVQRCIDSARNEARHANPA